MKNKIEYVQTLRGIACIALVMFHVIGNDPRGGLRLDEGHYLVFFVNLFRDFRMPLFSFISGFVFIAIVRDLQELKSKILKKARRLLIPLVTVCSLFWLTQYKLGMDVPSYLHSLYLPYAHFWYLKATFVLMTIFYSLMFLSGNRHILVPTVLFFVGGGIWIFTPGWDPNVFGSYNACFLAPFFMCGYLCAQGDGLRGSLDRINGWPHLLLLAAVIGAALVWFEARLNEGIFDPYGWERKASTVAVGLTACLMLFAIRPTWKPLARIGDYSYGIFLFHVFFTAAVRMFLVRILPGLPDLLLLAAGMTVGLAGPILLLEVIQRSRWASLLFLGIAMRPPATMAGSRPRPEAVS